MVVQAYMPFSFPAISYYILRGAIFSTLCAFQRRPELLTLIIRQDCLNLEIAEYR